MRPNWVQRNCMGTEILLFKVTAVDLKGKFSLEIMVTLLEYESALDPNGLLEARENTLRDRIEALLYIRRRTKA